MRLLFLCLVLVPVLPAIEVATGSMLGLRYDQRAFYVRTPENQIWRKTYTGKGYRG